MKINLHLGLRRAVLFEKHSYSIEYEKRMFLLEKLDGCEIKLYEDYQHSVFYVKSDRILFEQNKKNNILWVNYYEIWSVFESKYSMNYQQIKTFTKHTLEKPLKWKEFTPVLMANNYRCVEKNSKTEGVYTS